jgi:hypothetical protein
VVNIKMNVAERGRSGVDWLALGRDRDKRRAEEWCLLGCYAVWLL